MQIKNLPGMDQYSKLDKAERDNQARAEKSSKATAAASQPTSGDKSTVSGEARLHADAYIAATSAPEIRTEKVAEIKAMVDSGKYVIDTKDIAMKLLRENSEFFGA